MSSEKKEPNQKEPWQEFRAEDGTEMFIITRTGRSTTLTLIGVRVKDFHPNLRYRLPRIGMRGQSRNLGIIHLLVSSIKRLALSNGMVFRRSQILD
jgi:hypothetical protein